MTKDNTPAPETLESLATHAAELETSHRAKLQHLKEMRTKAGEVRAPLGAMLRRRNEIVEQIRGTERQLQIHVERHAQFQALIANAFRDETDSATAHGFLSVVRNNPLEAVSERAIVELDKFLPGERAKLPALEKEIVDYAREHQLDYVLADEPWYTAAV